MDETYYDQERERMVIEQLLRRDIRDQRVINAFRRVPRHRFVSPEYSHLAYADGPLPIGNNQTISQPYIVALMTQLLNLRPNEKVLEIGTGSGYQAAILAHLAKEVHTVERHTELAERASHLLEKLGIDKVTAHVGDGSLGWPENAPYDGIVATAAPPSVPPPLLEQLAVGGRLVLPVGERGNQFLELWIRRKAKFVKHEIAPVAFVPLLGEYGWRENDWEW
jgi:protein-L-isoaspartate(D-aspartate) O-methyltransferase